MTTTGGTASRDASVPSGPPAGAEADGHEHAWALMRFELVDDRPVVRQTCTTCGLVHGYRAWERYWSPGEGEVRRRP